MVQKITTLAIRQTARERLTDIQRGVQSLQSRIQELRTPRIVRRVRGIEGLRKVTQLRKNISKEIIRGISERRRLQEIIKLPTREEFITQERARISAESERIKKQVSQALRRNIPERLLSGATRKIVKEFREGRRTFTTILEQRIAAQERESAKRKVPKVTTLKGFTIKDFKAIPLNQTTNLTKKSFFNKIKPPLFR